MDLEDEIRCVFNTFRMDNCSRDYHIEDVKVVTWITLNDYLRQKVGHPLSRWFLLLDLKFYHALQVSSETIATLRHEVLMSEQYISRDLGKLV